MSVTIKYASPAKRLSAFLIDEFIVFIISIVLLFLAEIVFGHNVPPEIPRIIQEIFHYSFLALLLIWRQQTIGGYLMKIKVIKDPSYMKKWNPWGMYLVREIAIPVSVLVLGLGCFWVFWDKKSQTWHDKLTKTIVVEA